LLQRDPVILRWRTELNNDDKRLTLLLLLQLRR
jgi:hypothetical protein